MFLQLISILEWRHLSLSILPDSSDWDSGVELHLGAEPGFRQGGRGQPAKASSVIKLRE